MRGVHQALAEIYRRTEHPDWAAVEEQKEEALPPLDCESPDEAGKIECAWREKRFEEVLRLAKGAEAAGVVLLAGARLQRTDRAVVRQAGGASGIAAAPRVDGTIYQPQRALCRKQ